jgi:hypothetical protein
MSLAFSDCGMRNIKTHPRDAKPIYLNILSELCAFAVNNKFDFVSD